LKRTAGKSPSPEAERLERLWGGTFGDAYIARNLAAGQGRGAFWTEQLAQTGPRRVLEVGCNIGANLRWIAESGPRPVTVGVDINQKAVDQVRRELPGASALRARARDLPFADRSFDLVFTTGVLIHQPHDTLAAVMGEIVRCSARWVLCGEYHAEVTTEVAYRGEPESLFKRDYGALYLQQFPELRLRRQGFLSRAEGWDDITWWLFERT
jgi:pseudaminic acid biosynthesis-associated methylase